MPCNAVIRRQDTLFDGNETPVGVTTSNGKVPEGVTDMFVMKPVGAFQGIEIQLVRVPTFTANLLVERKNRQEKDLVEI